MSPLEEIEQYVLSSGAHAPVLKPGVLRQRLGATARTLVGRYEDGRMGNPKFKGTAQSPV